jgi:hypothetical protein
MTDRQVWYNVLKERYLPAACVEAIEDIAMSAGKYGAGRLQAQPMRTDMARSNLARWFMTLTAQDGRQPDETDTLIMLDNDHIHDRETLPRLVTQITDRAGGVGIVGALTFLRKEPYNPLLFSRRGDGTLGVVGKYPAGLCPGVVVSHAAIAIARWVFEDLETADFHQPYWRYEYTDGACETKDMPSEDVYFGKCCEKAGITTWCDTTLIAPHYTDRAIDGGDWIDYAEAHPEILGKLAV